jgi:geranylgeranyl diphosphate synthase type II
LFDKIFIEKKEDIERVITRYLPKEEGYPKTVIEAMNYSVLVGGKRIRPMLLRETYALFGGESLIIEPYLAAIEFIHSYSLVHDDLPALDNDELRRGNLTTHIKFGHAMGILAGDALLNYSYEILSSAYELSPMYIDRCAKANKYISKKAGIYGMIGGQVVDIEAVGKTLDIESIEYIHMNKTSALIQAAMCAGAILAGATVEELNVVEEAANKIGLAFQIQDDILDIVGDEDKLGKAINSDAKNQKTTYVTIKGIEESRKDVETLTQSALDNLKALGYTNDFLFALIEKLINRIN